MNNEKVLAILKRAAWTFLQAFLAILIANITSGMAFSEVNWQHIFDVGVVAGILSVAKSWFVGVPEATTDGTLNIDIKNPNVWQFDFNQDPSTFHDKKRITLNVNLAELDSKKDSENN